MTEDRRGLTWPQIRYWLICSALIVVGILATIWGGPFDRISPIIKELGPGIFTAGILASLVEPFFRNEFARDAFLAAFRYVLPDELKEEVRRILNYKFLCIEKSYDCEDRSYFPIPIWFVCTSGWKEQ